MGEGLVVVEKVGEGKGVVVVVVEEVEKVYAGGGVVLVVML